MHFIQEYFQFSNLGKWKKQHKPCRQINNVEGRDRKLDCEESGQVACAWKHEHRHTKTACQYRSNWGRPHHSVLKYWIFINSLVEQRSSRDDQTIHHWPEGHQKPQESICLKNNRTATSAHHWTLLKWKLAFSSTSSPAKSTTGSVKELLRKKFGTSLGCRRLQ